MRTNQEYKNAALDSLRGNWAPAVLSVLALLFFVLLWVVPLQLPLYIPLSFLVIECISTGFSLVKIFLIAPLDAGVSNAFRLLYENRDDRIPGNMFRLAFSNYWHKVWGLFLKDLKLLLWMFLLIVPGFIMAYAYAMTPYILDEHPEISAWDASCRSQEMMRGHKLRLFWLDLSFIGWMLLSVLTLGIGLLWLGPYMEVSRVAFYNDLKAQQGEAAIME